MAEWIKKNLVLVAGIVLPAALVAAFALLQGVPRYVGESPQYDFLVAAYRYDAQHPSDYTVTFEVSEGRLQGRATRIKDARVNPNRRRAVLYRYDAKADRFNEIEWEEPAELEAAGKRFDFSLQETRHLKLDNVRRSPDGFEFEFAGYRGGGGMLGALFGMDRGYDRRFVLTREDAHYALPELDTRPYAYGRDVHFLGWVVQAEAES